MARDAVIYRPRTGEGGGGWLQSLERATGRDHGGCRSSGPTPIMTRTLAPKAVQAWHPKIRWLDCTALKNNAHNHSAMPPRRQFMPLRPPAEPPDRPRARRSRVRVANVRGEELDEPPDRIGSGVPDDRRHRDTGGRGKMTIAGNQCAVVQLRRRNVTHA
jgi:hypothetical protein